jgi:hypothetical protein
MTSPSPMSKTVISSESERIWPTSDAAGLVSLVIPPGVTRKNVLVVAIPVSSLDDAAVN